MGSIAVHAGNPLQFRFTVHKLCLMVNTIPSLLLSGSDDDDDSSSNDDDDNDERQVYKCMMKMGSWTYDVSGIDLQLMSGQIDLSTYAKNDRFAVISTEAKRNAFVYDCCPEEYIDLTYTITVRMRA